MAETQLRSGVYNYEISTVYPTSQVLLKWYSQFNLLCLTHVLSLFSLCLAPKGPLGEVTQKQMITEWYEHEMLKLSSRDEIEQQMSNTFFLWVRMEMYFQIILPRHFKNIHSVTSESDVHKQPFIRERRRFTDEAQAPFSSMRRPGWCAKNNRTTRRSLDEWTDGWRWNRASTAVRTEWRQDLSQQLMVHAHTLTHAQTCPEERTHTSHAPVRPTHTSRKKMLGLLLCFGFFITKD